MDVAQEMRFQIIQCETDLLINQRIAEANKHLDKQLWYIEQRLKYKSMTPVQQATHKAMLGIVVATAGIIWLYHKKKQRENQAA